MAAISLTQRRQALRHGPRRTQVIHGVNAEIADGEFIVIVGPSGCGKSTLLRMVAGPGGDHRRRDRDRRPRRQRPRAGRARHRDGVPELRAVSAHERVRQHGLRPEDRARCRWPRSRPASTRRPRSSNSASCWQRKPRELSGGQRQRVAMGRAIVRQPQVFLFDEPLSNLDAKLRAQTRLEIQKLHRELGITSLFVTHDQVEAMTLAAAHDRDERRRDGAVRHARRGLSPAGHHLRRQLHRLAADEPAEATRRASRAGTIMGIRPEHLDVGAERLGSCRWNDRAAGRRAADLRPHGRRADHRAQSTKTSRRRRRRHRP